MDNVNLIQLMYGITESASYAARDLKPGEVISRQGHGDNKRNIDQVAEEAALGHFLNKEPDNQFEAALKPEDAEWGDNWMKSSKETITGENLQKLDYGFIIDQVEGTKNYDNRDRYTTIAAINPEKPTLNGIEASLVYRWDDTVFFSDGENAYVNRNPEYNQHEMNVETATALKANEMDKIGYETKIRGQIIGLNSSDYAEITEKIIDHYQLEENEWPSLKADGTTTGDILGTVTDNSIAIDIRALKDRQRLPYAQDFAPAAKIAEDAGAEIINEEGEQVQTNFSKPGAATAYIALPPGKASNEIKNMIPELVELKNP